MAASDAWDVMAPGPLGGRRRATADGSFEAGRERGEASFRLYVKAAALAHELGLGINAGHDLDLHNLTLFRGLPHLDEVSIGHAVISRAIFVGLDTVVKEYLAVLTETG